MARCGWLARTLHLDPIHHLQRHWARKLTAFVTDLNSPARARALTAALAHAPYCPQSCNRFRVGTAGNRLVR